MYWNSYAIWFACHNLHLLLQLIDQQTIRINQNFYEVCYVIITLLHYDRLTALSVDCITVSDIYYVIGWFNVLQYRAFITSLFDLMFYSIGHLFTLSVD